MTIEALRPHLRAAWPDIRRSLDEGTYRPSPVRRVTIPKPGGGDRELGVPTVLDRFLQQALSQVLTPVFEPSFSDQSFGFRPGRSAHQAVEAARRAIEAGETWVVDVDLDRFFDRVQHDALMARVARRVDDRRVLRLIRRYLDAGVMVEGVKVATVEGTPQGSPLSPLLANIMLDDLDHELERRGHAFVRYADDLRVYVASANERRARVLEGVTAFVEQRLKLQVNREKSGVAPATRRGLLGFGFFEREGRVRVRLDRKAKHRLKARLRHLTSRRWSDRDVRPARAARPVHRLAGPPTSRWPRRPRCSTSSTSGSDGGCGRSAGRSGSGSAARRRNLVALGIPRRATPASGRPAGRATGGSRGPPVLSRALPNRYWADLGLVSMSDRVAPAPGALANRRMRTRTSGGVGGGGLTPPPTRSGRGEGVRYGYDALWCAGFTLGTADTSIIDD